MFSSKALDHCIKDGDLGSNFSRPKLSSSHFGYCIVWVSGT